MREEGRVDEQICPIIKLDGVVKSPIYCVAAIFQALDIPYVLSRT
jgi:hypothetical protein